MDIKAQAIQRIKDNEASDIMDFTENNNIIRGLLALLNSNEAKIMRLQSMVEYDCREPGVCPDVPVWVHCSLLPESDQTVLICMPDSDNPVDVGFHDGEAWFDYNGAPLTGDNAVNYWMPLPEPKLPESV